MDREGAHHLWQSTLALGLLPAGPSALRPLRTLWDAAGLTAAAQERLVGAAAEETGDLERRQRLVRETRGVIHAAGFDPDLLSTPAAGMRGL